MLYTAFYMAMSSKPVVGDLSRLMSSVPKEQVCSESDAFMLVHRASHISREKAILFAHGHAIKFQSLIAFSS